MYCPRCGQLQIDENTRFCSRCGFLLTTISQVLANGGEIPFQFLAQNKAKFFTRRNGLTFSLIWFMVFTLIFTPIAAVLFGDTKLEMIIPFFGIVGTMGGLVMAILSLLLPSSRAKNQNNAYPISNYAPSNQISGIPNNQTALPPQAANFTPVNSVEINQNPQPIYAPPTQVNWRGAKTGELVQPPSVIEDTTKLLNQDK